jgi:hypothetical protein
MPTIQVRRIALPTEHGGWGFLLEPLVAGLSIAFSIGGVWIAVMIIGAFLLRQPLKMLILDRRGTRDGGRAAVARKYICFYTLICASGAIGAFFTAGIESLVPLACVLPLAAVQNYHDTFRRSRNLVAEIAGAVAISASIAAIAIAGGLNQLAALGLWAVFVARLVPSILYVRERLLVEKGKAYSRLLPIIVHFAAVGAIGTLAVFGLASFLTVAVMLILLFRCYSGLRPGRKPMKAMQIGVRELIYGIFLVISVVVGRYAGI